MRKRLYLLPRLYGALGKLKLSALVVATTIAGFQVASSYGHESFELLGWTAFGVALSSFSANTFNQWMEAPFDSQMARTRLRPLPTHQLGSAHAFTLASLMGVAGVGLLAIKVGWLPATFAGINILLYAALYTPMKRSSIANTWVGAVVGAIPPMIGFVAANGSITPGCLTLGAILYCWQFPHFNSLSWNLKHDYSRAGYCMTAVLEPKLNVDSALRHSLALFPLSTLMSAFNVCNYWFLLDSSLLNAAMVFLAWKFRKSPSRSSARRLFFFSLLHLPLILILMAIHKRRGAQEEEEKSPLMFEAYLKSFIS